MKLLPLADIQNFRLFKRSSADNNFPKSDRAPRLLIENHLVDGIRPTQYLADIIHEHVIWSTDIDADMAEVDARVNLHVSFLLCQPSLSRPNVFRPKDA